MAILTKPQLLTEVGLRIRSAGAGGLTTAADHRSLVTDVIESLFKNDDDIIQIIGELGNLYVTIATGQTIEGEKTFVVSPSVPTPTEDAHAAHKKYVDDLISDLAATIVINGPFDATRVIKRQIEGLEGENFNVSTVTATLEALLYPTKNPGASISLPVYVHEYGDSGTVAVDWTATRTDAAITQIFINGVPQSVTGNTQSGTTNIAKSGSANTNFTIVVVAGKTTTKTVTSIVSKKIRIGGVSKNGTTNPILDSDINGIASVFATEAKAITHTTVAAGHFLVVALPSAFTMSKIFINGNYNNAFTKVRSASSFINSFGYTDSFDVWVSDHVSTGAIHVELK